MSETIKLDVKLRAFVRRETKRRWVAVCPMLGVASQGASQPSAKTALQEAVELWFESCLERGVLDQALREANFRPRPINGPIESDEERVFVSHVRTPDEEDVLGKNFAIHLTIPAYQAAAFSNSGL